MTKEEFCKELKESQERGILSVCSTAQKYVNSLEAENERLKNELQLSATNCNKLKCLDLLLASEMYWFKSLCNKYEGSDWWAKMKRQSVYYRKAYRKAKAELKEKK